MVIVLNHSKFKLNQPTDTMELEMKKQETIEEAAENYAEKWNDLENQFKLSSCFIAGVKWEQERMYRHQLSETKKQIKKWKI